MRTRVNLLVVFLCVKVAFGATFYGEIMTEKVYGKIVKFCEYKQLRLLPVSVIKDYDDCVKCSCTNKGLSCVSMAMNFTYPDDSKCVVVTIGCKTRWVLRNNKNRRCPKKLIPQFSAVGK